MSRIVLSDRHVLQSYPNSSRLEWLETNGTGAFAMGTVAGANTKRTHAHLIAPDGRVLLAKYDEDLVWNGHRAALGVNQYPGELHPRGHQFLEHFRLDPFPAWRYRCEEVVLERSLFLVPGHTTVVVEWRLVEGPKCWLEVRPFFALRSLDELQHSAPLPPLRPPLHHSQAKVFGEGYWYFNFVYDTGQEDLHSPAVYQFRLEPGNSAWMAVTSESGAISDADIERWRDERLARPRSRADDFVIGLREIRPGYPRGTPSLEQELIALPGLLLTRGKDGEARRILTRALGETKPSLWLFPALMEYQRKVGEDAFLAEIAYPGTRAVLDAWLEGADARTRLLPRPAGANALWLNALLIHNMLAAIFGKSLDERRRYQPVLRAALAHYEASFWPEGKVRELDPDQLLAVSLPFVCVEGALQRTIVEAMRFTPLSQTWMLAHYLLAYLRVKGYTPEAIAYCREELARVEAQRREGCLGHLPLETESASAIRLGEYLRARDLLAGL